MALGDAIAVALLNRMGLTADDFKKFHPGGKLGQKLLTVESLMLPLKDMALIDHSKNMDEAIVLLAEKNLGMVCVLNDTKTLIGIITDGDLKRHMSPDLMEKPVTSIMTKSPKTITKDALAAKALNIMSKTPGQYLTSLIVMDEHQTLQGLIRLQDCLSAGVE